MGVTPFLRHRTKEDPMSRIIYAKPGMHGSAFGQTTQTFPELLADPLTRALMAADGVDAEALEAELRQIAAKLSPAASDSEGLCSAFC
jgi:hypothetical protein